jgi:Carboxypeptidase regulatory-like domain/TonB-dependent Receptor Plug Domain
MTIGAHINVFIALLAFGWPSRSGAQTTGRIAGRVTDETGGTLPGVTVELRSSGGPPRDTVTSASGDYAFETVAAGTCQLSFTLINFASLTRRDVPVGSGISRIDVSLHLSLNAEVTVTGKRTFANLADVENPAENLVGVAQSASQGAITARQLDVRPIMRQGEVLETVPGVIITQHSGEGKANQYFLRGFNLDHGSDFAMTVAGTPVNMPTHAHSQGYSDINFLIPDLFDDAVSDIDYYFASRLPGEPLGGVNDVHSHPAVPRTARFSLSLSF